MPDQLILFRILIIMLFQTNSLFAFREKHTLKRDDSTVSGRFAPQESI